MSGRVKKDEQRGTGEEMKRAQRGLILKEETRVRCRWNERGGRAGWTGLTRRFARQSGGRLRLRFDALHRRDQRQRPMRLSRCLSRAANQRSRHISTPSLATELLLCSIAGLLHRLDSQDSSFTTPPSRPLAVSRGHQLLPSPPLPPTNSTSSWIEAPPLAMSSVQTVSQDDTAAMIKLGLDRITRLVSPSTLQWKAIHVAGTNGKGSVCAAASAMLHASGVQCGRFTSPHLIDR